MKRVNKKSITLFNEPNKYARQASLECKGKQLVFHGYQEFVLTSSSVKPLDEDDILRRKQALLSQYFTPCFMHLRTLLDLGANAGFFSFWAIQSGCVAAVSVDTDKRYIDMLNKARQYFKFSNLRVIDANVTDWNEPADIVLALALVHWIYSCTACFGSLDAIIGRLADLSRYMIIVEWIDPYDQAIQSFHHLEWNKEHIQGEYSIESFERSLQKYFVRFEKLGSITPTRVLYAAYKTLHEIDLSVPLPLILSKEAVISSRLLATYGGVEYWSVVYEQADLITKQTSFDLAEREAGFLKRLDSEYFPKVIDTYRHEAYSVVVLENIVGKQLSEEIASQTSSRNAFYQLIQHCLNILNHLSEKGILHRDIRIENLMIREGKPVLLDFGWAVSSGNPLFTPSGLGGTERPEDGSFCDIYSMGKVLETVNRNRYPCFQDVIALMTASDASMRVTDIHVLETLFAVAGRVKATGRHG